MLVGYRYLKKLWVTLTDIDDGRESRASRDEEKEKAGIDEETPRIGPVSAAVASSTLRAWPGRRWPTPAQLSAYQE